MWNRKIELEKQYEWSKKGKKYRTKYFGALKSLYGAVKDDKECQGECDTYGRNGTDPIRDVVGE